MGTYLTKNGAGGADEINRRNELFKNEMEALTAEQDALFIELRRKLEQEKIRQITDELTER